MSVYRASKVEKSVERKIIRRNLILISIGLLAFISFFSWGWYGAHREILLLEQYGKEVTAIYVDARLHRNGAGGSFSGGGAINDPYNGYIMVFEYYDEETDNYYFGAGNKIYEEEAEAKSHIGDEVQIVIYRNICELKANMGKGLSQYGMLWLVLGIATLILMMGISITVIIFRKKIFLSKKDRMAKYCLPESIEKNDT